MMRNLARILLVGATALLLSNFLHAAQIQGKVRGPEGEAVAGATISVYEAGPRKGVSAFCPSCYRDCGKVARSGADGRFVIEGLDDTLVFRLLLLAEGYTPRFVVVDPAKGGSEFTLEKRDLSKIPTRTILAGRVVDPEGKPVAGASLEPLGFQRGREMQFGGLEEACDPLGITDSQGAFALVLLEGAEFFVRVKARGLARKVFSGLETGKGPVTLKLERGATVSGRVAKGGSPVEHAVVRLDQVDRRMQTYLGPLDIGTDAHGQFSLPNVATNQKYAVFVKMGAGAGHAVAPVKRIDVPADKRSVSSGTFELTPGYHVSGRLLTSGGQPLNEPGEVILTRDSIFDGVLTKISPEGSFEFDGVPPEKISLRVMVPGYRIDTKTRFFVADYDPRFSHLEFVPSGPVQEVKIVMVPQEE